MKAKLRYVFDRKKSANESLKEKPIELEIYFPDKTRLYYYTRISVEPKHWDTTRQLVSNKHGLANQYNQYLEFLKKEVTKAEIDAIENDNIFTRDMAKDLLYNRGNLDSFIEYAHACNSEDLKIGNIEFASWKRYNTIIRTFDKYCHQKLGRQCSFNDLNETFIKQLSIWLNERYKLSSAAKFHVSLKKFVDRAYKDKKLKKNPYEGDFKIKKAPTAERASLTHEELARLEALDRSLLQTIDALHLESVLDRFLFSCYTGLRISDNIAVEKRNITEGADGLCLDIVTEKMQGARVILPLDKLFDGKPGIIARKYMKSNDTTLFPKLSEQKINLKLKILLGLAKIEQKATFHTARHTCASLLAEATGNPFVIMKILGHTDIKTSMIYIHNSQQSIINSLSNAKW